MLYFDYPMRLKAQPSAAQLRLFGSGHRPEQGEQGTTLVEIVVAGAILAVGSAGLDARLGTFINEVKRDHTASPRRVAHRPWSTACSKSAFD